MSLVNRVDRLWSNSSIPPNIASLFADCSYVSAIELLSALKLDQRQRWKSSIPLLVEDYLALLGNLPPEVDWKLELAVSEFEARQQSDRPLSIDALISRFPDLSDTLRQQLAVIESAASHGVPSEPPDTVIRRADELSASYISGRGIGIGEKGRYRLDRVIGEGAFGRVYLGYDDELRRQVAIKVPCPERFKKKADAEQYLSEARTAATLEHPHIVSVYDVGRTDDGSIYVVSRYIDGGTLKDRIRKEPLDPCETTKWLIPVAEALHFAHQRRLIHRDVKPANILLDGQKNTPFIADFGLAIREEDYLHDRSLAGTPAYMSPEQARAEGHRLDGRSDVFSLGVILYEMLTGQRPFRGATTYEIIHEVISIDPPSPRLINAQIPAELERICLKALSKRISDRFSSAEEMAKDMEAWLRPAETGLKAESTRLRPVVPRGLRSFGRDDADFFLDLLPGQRDRNGLPESIAFWKRRIESCELDYTFPVGLMLGPSGCGKSSLVKAGLIPRLSPLVNAVYLEATAEETERRILNGIRKTLPEISENLSLTETMIHIRTTATKKTVIIIDQFEQWLHTHQGTADNSLIPALMQCDGLRVQAVIMVRDDFAMAAARCMQSLDLAIVQGQNFATVDLFEIDHAKNILVRFGQAFGKLPALAVLMTKDDRQFVSDVAHGLSHDGKVVSVRLALFAEMIKNKRWHPDTLRQVGGTVGIGVNFLEETFSTPQANPGHRLHAEAARSVLKTLLPNVGTDIKGHMRTQSELMEVAGMAKRPSDFHSLLRILDGELRLITPTDPEGDSSGDSDRDSSPEMRCYQLTHDYLVPSLRHWLTRKQRETARGRAELILEERTATWSGRKENQQLPTFLEWLQILRRTANRHWTEPQRAMMGTATRRQMMRSVWMFAVGLFLLFVGQRFVSQQSAHGIVESLKHANPRQLPQLLARADAEAKFVDPLLRKVLENSGRTNLSQTPENFRQLNLLLALVSRDPGLLQGASEAFLTADLSYARLVVSRLQSHRSELKQQWLAIFRNPAMPSIKRFRAAIGVAAMSQAPSDVRWTEEELRFIARETTFNVSQDDSPLLELISPISADLRPALKELYLRNSSNDIGVNAAILLRAALKDSPNEILSLILTGGRRQAYIMGKVLRENDDGIKILLQHWRSDSLYVESLDNLASNEEAAVLYAEEKTKLALALISAGQSTELLTLLGSDSESQTRTNLITAIEEANVRTSDIQSLFENAKSPLARQALYMALAQYPHAFWLESDNALLLEKASSDFLYHPAPEVHSAVDWFLRKIGQGDQLRVMREQLHEESQRGTRNLYVSPSDITFAIVTGPREVSIGSHQAGWGMQPQNPIYASEKFHHRHIGRTFAVSTHEVTNEQLELFAKQYPAAFGRTSVELVWSSRTFDSPAVHLDWYTAVKFCRWLGEWEEIPESQQCYPPISEIRDGMKLPEDYLHRTGYRLPTEAEWEYACRANSRGMYWFGADAKDLSKHAWCVTSSGQTCYPVAQLRPNALGLFDISGNAFEWVDVRLTDYPVVDQIFPVIEDSELPGPCLSEDSTVLRGGDFVSDDSRMRAAHRTKVARTNSWPASGLRIARTISTPPLQVFPIESDSTQSTFAVRGKPAKFRVTEVTGDAYVAIREGDVPSEIVVRARNGQTALYGLQIDSDADPGGIRVAGEFIPVVWRLRWFAWAKNDQNVNGPSTEKWNQALTGETLFEENRRSLKIDFGSTSPATNVPANFCGLVATTEVTLQGGDYEFECVSGAGGCRVQLNETSLLSLDWPKHRDRTVIRRNLPSGQYHIKVEAFHVVDTGMLDFRIRRVQPSP